MKLCKFCNSSKGNAFAEAAGSGCFLCGDALSQLPQLAESAAKKIPESISTFSVSSKIPIEWLAREDLLWDEKLENTSCIKGAINHFLGKKISELSKKKPITDGDVIITVDVVSGDVAIAYNDLFIFGRYKKLAAGLSQSRWLCSKCNGKGCKSCDGKGKFYVSVEEEIGEILKKECQAAGYSLHASGREDVDVVNTAGRPFIFQLKEAKNRKPDLSAVSNTISSGGKVAVADLEIAERSSVELVASSHFDKTYIALVEFEQDVSRNDIEKLLGLSGQLIVQRTPVRVEHRRADLDRQRKLLSVKCISYAGKTAEFEISAEAGTYIKELITGDGERTKPSFSSVLGMPVACKQLKVAKIDDSFLDDYF